MRLFSFFVCLINIIILKVSAEEQDKEGDTPLHYAAREGFKEMVEILLKACPKNSKYKTSDEGKNLLKFRF